MNAKPNPLTQETTQERGTGRRPPTRSLHQQCRTRGATWLLGHLPPPPAPSHAATKTCELTYQRWHRRCSASRPLMLPLKPEAHHARDVPTVFRVSRRVATTSAADVAARPRWLALESRVAMRAGWRSSLGWWRRCTAKKVRNGCGSPVVIQLYRPATAHCAGPPAAYSVLR